MTLQERVDRNTFLRLLLLPLDTEEDCKQCETVLQEMENIDDEAEAAG